MSATVVPRWNASSCWRSAWTSPRVCCESAVPEDVVVYLHPVAGEKPVRRSPGNGKRVSSLRENPVSSLGEMVLRLRGQSLTLGPHSRGSAKQTEQLDLIMIRLRLREPSSRFLEPVHDTSPRVAKSSTGTAAVGGRGFVNRRAIGHESGQGLTAMDVAPGL